MDDRHGMTRAQQRAIRPEMVDFVLEHADVDLEAGNGCRASRISNRRVTDLLRDRADVAVVERARNIVVITCGEEIVTVMRDYNQNGRRFRRQWPTWSSRPTKRFACAA
jgi:hypothetical protein